MIKKPLSVVERWEFPLTGPNAFCMAISMWESPNDMSQDPIPTEKTPEGRGFLLKKNNNKLSTVYQMCFA